MVIVCLDFTPLLSPQANAMARRESQKIILLEKFHKRLGKQEFLNTDIPASPGIYTRFLFLSAPLELRVSGGQGVTTGFGWCTCLQP